MNEIEKVNEEIARSQAQEMFAKTLFGIALNLDYKIIELVKEVLKDPDGYTRKQLLDILERVTNTYENRVNFDKKCLEMTDEE